jgi:hypothetical protein
MKTFRCRSTCMLLFSSAATLALLLAANVPVLVSARLSAAATTTTTTSTRNHRRETQAANKSFKVSFDSARSTYGACPSGSLVATVLNRSNNRPLSNKKVTFTIVASATSTSPAATIKRVTRTSASGKAAFDYALTSQQLHDWSGRKLKCSVRVDNALVSGGYQTVACPKDIQLCSVPNCAGTVGEVVCQGDMIFDSMCDAVAGGMYQDECVPEDVSVPDCQQLAGFVQCAGTDWYASMCDAVAGGYSTDACEQVDDALVPDCAKSGEVLCQGAIVFANLCSAASGGIAPEDCVPAS